MPADFAPLEHRGMMVGTTDGTQMLSRVMNGTMSDGLFLQDLLVLAVLIVVILEVWASSIIVGVIEDELGYWSVGYHISFQFCSRRQWRRMHAPHGKCRLHSGRRCVVISGLRWKRDVTLCSGGLAGVHKLLCSAGSIACRWWSIFLHGGLKVAASSRCATLCAQK